jgi:hypothetical protein
VANYVSADELREYIGSDTSQFEGLLETACAVASRTVENMTGRIFFDTGNPSILHFEPTDPYCVQTDDFSTLTGLVVEVDTGYDNTYATTLTIDTDFIAQPRDQLRNGQPWPYTSLQIAPRSRHYFPPAYLGQHETVRVTARWGWASVPEQVKHACLIGAKEWFSRKDTNAGGYFGMDGWGPVRMRENSDVRALIGPYTLNGPVTVL